jgi:hypothetical protein
MTANELDHHAKVMLWVIGHCNSLVEKGLLAGGPSMTPEGKVIFEELLASDFTITAQERDDAMRVLCL